MRKMCSARSALQKPRRLHDIFRRNIRDTQKSSQFLGKSERKHLIGRLAAVNVATDAVDVRKIKLTVSCVKWSKEDPFGTISRKSV